MGRIERQGDRFVFKQDDGAITAWFPDDEENRILSHKGDPTYRRVFLLLVVLGMLYLGLIFISY